MRFRSLPLLMLSSLALHAGDIALTDSTVIPGERVGPIEKGMTLPGLKALLLGTQEKMPPVELPGAEGETISGAVLFKGTDREIDVIFNPEGDEKEITEVRIVGKSWKFPGGLKKGMSAEEVEKVNGQPYKIAGFEWDYGGYADFSGGKLEGKVSIRFEHHEKDLDPSLVGDHMIPSDDAKLRKAKVTVGELSVMLPVKEDIPKEDDAAKDDNEPKKDDEPKKEETPKKEDAPKKAGE
jgi:hypothetical protein